jgi:hypothetical protein
MIEIFKSIVTAGAGLTLNSYFIALGCSLFCGLIVLLATAYRNHITKSFALTVLLLPAIVQTVIMMVNGNVGTGIAVAGAFSLVRFRSVPGKAREIASIFLSMTAGLACAAGYVAIGIVFTALVSVVMLVFAFIPLKREREYELRITIPESLAFNKAFDDIFDEYTKSYRLTKTKTSNMGSLYKLTYIVDLKDPDLSQEMIDALRTRNGNLEIALNIAPEENEL